MQDLSYYIGPNLKLIKEKLWFKHFITLTDKNSFDNIMPIMMSKKLKIVNPSEVMSSGSIKTNASKSNLGSNINSTI